MPIYLNFNKETTYKFHLYLGGMNASIKKNHKGKTEA